MHHVLLSISHKTGVALQYNIELIEAAKVMSGTITSSFFYS